MHRIYFTSDEARKKTDERVEAVTDFPSVPRGSKGTVVKALEDTEGKWVVRVEWLFPKRTSFMDVMFADVSLNLFKRVRPVRPVRDDFCKSEYEKLLTIT